MMRLILSICLLALLTAACSKIPSQSSYPYSYQHKVQSADHWERLAQDIVSEQIVPYIRKNKDVSKVYLHQKDKSDFGIALHTYMLTELFERKIEVAESYSPNAAALEWSVQQVRHERGRENPSPIGGALGYVGYITMEFAGFSSYSPFSKVPNSELIISAKLTNNGEIMSIKTETFYVDDMDTGNYWFIEDYNEELAYINKGSVVCKNKRSLYSALNEDGFGYSSLETLSALGDCAVMTKNHPVTIIGNDGQSLVIRSLDDSTTYVTSTSSATQLQKVMM